MKVKGKYSVATFQYSFSFASSNRFNSFALYCAERPARWAQSRVI